MLEKPTVGLCPRCRHVRVVTTTHGATYWLCQLAQKDHRFAKYPRLPVLTCSGFDGGRTEK